MLLFHALCHARSAAPLLTWQSHGPGPSQVREAWLHEGGIAHLLVLRCGLLFTVGHDGVLVACKLPWPAVPATEPEWPGCSLVMDKHIQVSSRCFGACAPYRGGAQGLIMGSLQWDPAAGSVGSFTALMARALSVRHR